MNKSGNKFDAFAASGIEAWERAATDELQGADPWKKLGREIHGLAVKPFYAPQTTATEFFHLPPANGTFLGPRTWYNCPRVIVKNVVEANAKALEHLSHGADGIFFELEDPVDFGILLKSVEWPICALSFLALNNSEAVADSLTKYIERIKGPAIGALFGGPVLARQTHPTFRFSGTIISQPSTIDSIAAAFIGIYRTLGNNFRTHARNVAFSVEVGTDFFFEAARLRAMRAAWSRLLRNQQAEDSPLFIHAWSRPWTSEDYAPNGNMLKATTAAMASVLGGCDILTIDPEDSSNPMMSRVARNVSIMLREESHFSSVADPLAGAYFVEDLTQQMTDLLWTKIQPAITA